MESFPNRGGNIKDSYLNGSMHSVNLFSEFIIISFQLVLLAFLFKFLCTNYNPNTSNHV